MCVHSNCIDARSCLRGWWLGSTLRRVVQAEDGERQWKVAAVCYYYSKYLVVTSNTISKYYVYTKILCILYIINNNIIYY